MKLTKRIGLFFIFYLYGVFRLQVVFFLYKLVTSIFLFFFVLCLKIFKFKTSQIQVRQETTRLYLGSFYLSSIKLNCSGFIQNKIKTNCKKGLYNVSPAKMSELRILMLAANRKGESKGESRIQHIICLVDQWKKHQLDGQDELIQILFYPSTILKINSYLICNIK